MYEIFEHTADFGIRAQAERLDSLFVEAARGLFALMVTHPEAVQPREERTFQIQGDDLEALLHDWLDELLFLFSAKRLAFIDFQVAFEGDIAHPTGLTATVRGEPLDLERHGIEVEVKAITWHALRIVHQNEGWLSEVIVDV
jgi:SHS2 domain-containing protein